LEPRRAPNITSPGKEPEIRNTLRLGAAALAIVLAACGTPTTTVSDPTATSSAAPATESEPGLFDFTAQTLDGETIEGETPQTSQDRQVDENRVAAVDDGDNDSR
jgi:hypothetical protein